MDEKENHMLEGFKRGKSAREILTCRQILNIIVFLGFMVNYMLRVNLTFAIVDMVMKRENNVTNNDTSIEVITLPTTSQPNRKARSSHSFGEFPFDDELDLSSDLFQDANDFQFNQDSGTKNRRSSQQNEDSFSNVYDGGSTFAPTDITELNDTQAEQNQTSRFGPDHVIRFPWSESQVGCVLGSFFWGYICTEIPGGRLAEIIGARKVFGYATMGASVLTLLAPMSAKISFLLLLMNRILMGAFLGPTWPAILPLAGNWIPPDERGKFLSNMMASTLGAAFTLPVCGFIIAHSSWEYVFYLSGLIGFVWSICWFLLIYDSPATHPHISDEERFYIESKLGVNVISTVQKVIPMVDSQVTQTLIRDREKETGDDTGNSDGSDEETKARKSKRCDYTSIPQADFKNGINGGASTNADEMHVLRSLNSPDNLNYSPNSIAIKNKNVDVDMQSHQSGKRAPWFSIITSVPVWAFILTHGASVFGYFTITNQLPTFMKHILHYDIKSNGILSGLPYLGKYMSALIGGLIADYLIRSSTLSRNTVRKMFTSVGLIVPGFIMVVQIFLGSNKVLSIILFTFTLVANGFVTGGYLGNSLELAPHYSGTIFGLANMLSGFSGSLSAFLVGFLTEDNVQVYSQWQKVFAVVAVLYFLGGLIFLFFGSTKTQPWDLPESTNKNRHQIRTDK